MFSLPLEAAALLEAIVYAYAMISNMYEMCALLHAVPLSNEAAATVEGHRREGQGMWY
jgi:hypothetical protein